MAIAGYPDFARLQDPELRTQLKLVWDSLIKVSTQVDGIQIPDTAALSKRLEELERATKGLQLKPDVSTGTSALLTALRQRSIGAPLVAPTGILAAVDVQMWRVSVACHVKNVRGWMKDGTSCSVNAYRNSSETFLASNLAITPAAGWVDGGAVQNDALVPGDRVWIQVISPVGSPTEVNVQIDLEIDLPGGPSGAGL